jgi:hypothetical protein
MMTVAATDIGRELARGQLLSDHWSAAGIVVR